MVVGSGGGGRRMFVLQWMTIAAALIEHSSVFVAGGGYFKPFNVSYDHRAIIIDGQLRMLISAGIHYPRATPEIENEFGNIESSLGAKGKAYIKWAAEMAVGLGAGAPWVMCKQVDAPEYIIDACNGYNFCDGFRPNSPKKPMVWTENWDGRFLVGQILDGLQVAKIRSLVMTMMPQ